MAEYHHAASIVLINREGRFILQHRDDIPTISSPGMYSAWGGAAEGDETPLQAALRELNEEIGLRPRPEELVFFGDYPRRYKIKGKQVLNHVYLLRHTDKAPLQVREGQGSVVIDPLTDGGHPKLTKLVLEIMEDYNARRPLDPDR